MRPADEGKRTAAEAAVALVENGMQLGLGIGLHDALRPGRFGPAGGRGRTAGHRHAYLEADRGAGARPGHPARRLRHARGAGSGDRWRHEVERSTLRQIKGLGGALLREKIVAEASQRFVVAPTSLRSWTGLGSRVPLAVEVVRFGHVATMGFSRYHARDSGKVASTVTVAESHPRCKVH